MMGPGYCYRVPVIICPASRRLAGGGAVQDAPARADRRKLAEAHGNDSDQMAAAMRCLSLLAFGGYAWFPRDSGRYGGIGVGF
jgi:hypothetical protein